MDGTTGPEELLPLQLDIRWTWPDSVEDNCHTCT